MEINILFDEGLEGCLETGWLEKIVRKVLTTQGVKSKAELGLVIVGQEKIHQLNLRYLGEDEPTDVLAFPLLNELSEENPSPFVTPPDGVKHLGEVIISYPQAVIQAEEHHHSVKREVAILIIHGVLHLLGFDHAKPKLARQMRAREAEILSYVAEALQ